MSLVDSDLPVDADLLEDAVLQEGAVLLILRVPGSHDARIRMGKVDGRVDIKTARAGDQDAQVAERAFEHAKHHGMRLVALLILSSDLLHWGYNELLLPGVAKLRFVAHVREELVQRSRETTKMLEEMALRHDVSAQIRRVEADDPVAAAVEEAAKGYARIFLAKEKKHLFPLSKKTVEQQLRTATTSEIVTCP